MSNKIRILFLGELHSSHAVGWISLLDQHDGDFEIAGIHISSALPPKFGFSITDVYRDNLIFRYVIKELKRIFKKFAPGLVKKTPIDIEFEECDFRLIAKKIRTFQPHIIHTLGIFPASSLLMDVLSKYGVIGNFFWIVQARGGPDIAMNRKNKQLKHRISEIMNRCDYFIADNDLNYAYACELGLEERKLSGMGQVPGSGGVDVSMCHLPPSKKEKVILWPKAYNCIQSDGFVVIEALRIALPQLGDCKLIATATSPEVRYWIKELLSDFESKIEIYERLERKEILKFLNMSRVLLAPSLSDGIPNSMYEAMAASAVPILSPLETITPLFMNNENVIYARNLDAQGIAQALILAMSDDGLADKIAFNNTKLLPKLAARDVIREKVVSMYKSVSKHE